METLVVGAGAVADSYLDGLTDASAVSVAAVCDLRAERARRAANEYGCRAYDDLGDALASEPAPLVVNLTSHAAHAPVTRQALTEDRHVFSEKPLALDSETARELVGTAAGRDLGLGCGPTNPRNPGQRRAARLLADGRLGPVRVAYATAHVGRVTEWHERPSSFLAVGPLYDGGVYPLTLLVSWFGPVERVRTADATQPWPAQDEAQPDAPTHVEAVLEHAGGPRVRLTASLYAPHRAREFYGLELHGDGGSVYLDDAGAQADGDERVQFGRAGREYTAVPPDSPSRPGRRSDGPVALVRSIRRGRPSLATARRGAHVVAVCEAIERAAASGSASVADCGATTRPGHAPTYRLPDEPPSTASTPRLPAVGATVGSDGVAAAARALDAGCRLLCATPASADDLADAMSAPGAPDRESVHLAGRIPAAADVVDAGEQLRAALGTRLDSLLLGEPTAARVDRAETLRERRLVGRVGVVVDTVTAETQSGSLTATTRRPADAAVTARHEQGGRVLVVVDSPSDLVDDAVRAVAAARGLAPGRVAVAREARRGVVPVVSTDVTDALAGAGLSLTAAEQRRLAEATG